MSETNINFDNEFEVDDLDVDKDEGKKDAPKDGVVVSRANILLVKQLLQATKENNEKILELISTMAGFEGEDSIGIGQSADDNFKNNFSLKTADNGRIIEGVFDGENMIGPDGKQYSIPANYASKSKLVEGDIMKLTITSTGTFVYKQIGPIERKRIIGILEQDKAGLFIASSENKKFKILTASVTYFRGQIGDEVMLLIPKTGESKWAAVDNVIKNVAK